MAGRSDVVAAGLATRRVFVSHLTDRELATLSGRYPDYEPAKAELVPIFEKEGINLHIEPHPEDWVETLQPSVDIIRTINSDRVKFLYCSPHTFYFGDDVAAMIREAAPVLAHVHVADTFNHKASSGLRYIINPPGSTARESARKLAALRRIA